MVLDLRLKIIDCRETADFFFAISFSSQAVKYHNSQYSIPSRKACGFQHGGCSAGGGDDYHGLGVGQTFDYCQGAVGLHDHAGGGEGVGSGAVGGYDRCRGC